MREKQPGDVLYNVRVGCYDPRGGLLVPERDFDAVTEPDATLMTWQSLQRLGGPLSRELAERALAIIPPAEHPKIRFTVRAEVIAPAETSALAAKGWHTDYAHGVLEVHRRAAVHSYMLITGPPFTQFLTNDAVWLPPHKLGDGFARALATTAVEPFYVTPWTFVRFNATELHRATIWNGARPVKRLFFRATYDPLRIV